MPDDDIVTYNGVSMRRDYAESLAATQLCTHYRGHRKRFLRIRLGSEVGMKFRTKGLAMCPCCNTVVGQLHDPLCEYEECPRCHSQVMSCDCEFFTEDAVPAAS